MSCNTCGKSFSIIRKESGCPACGYSYCGNCLKFKAYLSKINSETKVCAKCSTNSPAQKQYKKMTREPPDSFIKRLELLENPPRPPITVYELDKYQKLKTGLSPEDQEIVDRLQQLKEKPIMSTPDSVEQQIADRLKRLRETDSDTKNTDEQLKERLAKLRGETSNPNSAILPPPDLRSDEEKSNDIIRQYMEEIQINNRHKKAFDSRISEIESKLQNLTGVKQTVEKNEMSDDSDNDEEIIQRVIEKAKAEVVLDNIALDKELCPASESVADTAELPWCEICNEDATLRCLGCKYLFCKSCYKEHKDDDLGCDKYELYKKPKNAVL